jgi:hypothetical protein
MSTDEGLCLVSEEDKCYGVCGVFVVVIHYTYSSVNKIYLRKPVEAHLEQGAVPDRHSEIPRSTMFYSFWIDCRLH